MPTPRSTWIAMGRPVLDETGTGLEPVALMVSEDEGWLLDFVQGLLNPHPTPSQYGVPLDNYVYDGWCFQDIEVVGPVLQEVHSVYLGEVGKSGGGGTSKECVLHLTRECTELVHVAMSRPEGSNLSDEMVDVVFAVAALAKSEGVDLDAAVRARFLRLGAG